MQSGGISAHDLSLDDDLSQPLSDIHAVEVISRLEQAVNQCRLDTPQRALDLSGLVIQIGELRHEPCEIALGMMLYADTLSLAGAGDLQTSWDMLDKAADLYLSCDDMVGWARTRIGRLGISYQVQRADEALADVAKAEAIFVRHDEYGKLLALRINTAAMYLFRGQYEDGLILLKRALQQAESDSMVAHPYTSSICASIGYAHSYLGNLEMAEAYYERAYQLDIKNEAFTQATISQISLSYIAQARCNYQEALRLLLNTQYLDDSSESRRLAIHFGLNQAELNIELNRYDEAYRLLQDTASQAEQLADQYHFGYALMLMGNLLVRTNRYAQASDILAKADVMFGLLGSDTSQARIRLQQGLIALKQNDEVAAQPFIDSAAAHFERLNHTANLARARLLQIELHLQRNDIEQALKYTFETMQLAEKSNIPTLKYQVQYLLGRVAEAESKPAQAIVRYLTACETVWDLQRSLTITIRPDFMVDKHDAAHAMIRLLLEQDNATGAFETVERIKAQIVLNELANRASLRWKIDTPETQSMVDELDRLRAQHQYVYRQLNPSPVERNTSDQMSIEQHQRLTRENSEREYRMQQLTEQLYLEAANDEHTQLVSTPDLAAIRQHISPTSAMLAYYDDGETMWGFIITRDVIRAHRLTISVQHASRMLSYLYDKIDFALDMRDQAAVLEQLEADIQKLLADLYECIVEPLLSQLVPRQQLTIVPYGSLHYLPFSALYDGEQYLVERFDLTILPAASLLTRRTVTHDNVRARVIGHTWNGHLRSVIEEATMVNELFGGEIYLEETAVAAALEALPCTLLHICTHGEFRIDQPEISFLQLDDCQLYTDDLLQHDMHYQLVVLSSCETGRAEVAPGDELIGLGRGFLYAGAGAVMTTLWRIESDHASELMHSFYQQAAQGNRIDRALANAQRGLLANPASRHPIFWAPFQLTGQNGSLLSTHHTVMADNFYSV